MDNTILDQKWWISHSSAPDAEHHEFFYGDYPMDTKKLALEFLIWNNKASVDLVKSLVPNVLDIGLFNSIDDRGNLRIHRPHISFCFNINSSSINEEILEHLLETYPPTSLLDSRMIIRKMINKMSISRLTKFIRDNFVSLTLELWEFLMDNIWIDTNQLDEFMDLIRASFETSSWKSVEEINKAFEIIQSDYDICELIGDVNLWYKFGNLFMEYGYDPSKVSYNSKK